MIRTAGNGLGGGLLISRSWLGLGQFAVRRARGLRRRRDRHGRCHGNRRRLGLGGHRRLGGHGRLGRRRRLGRRHRFGRREPNARRVDGRACRRHRRRDRNRGCDGLCGRGRNGRRHRHRRRGRNRRRHRHRRRDRNRRRHRHRRRDRNRGRHRHRRRDRNRRRDGDGLYEQRREDGGRRRVELPREDHLDCDGRAHAGLGAGRHQQHPPSTAVRDRRKHHHSLLERSDDGARLLLPGRSRAAKLVSGITVDTSEGADITDVAQAYEVDLSTDGTTFTKIIGCAFPAAPVGGHQFHRDDGALRPLHQRGRAARSQDLVDVDPRVRHPV